MAKVELTKDVQDEILYYVKALKDSMELDISTNIASYTGIIWKLLDIKHDQATRALHWMSKIQADGNYNFLQD